VKTCLDALAGIAVLLVSLAVVIVDKPSLLQRISVALNLIILAAVLFAIAFDDAKFTFPMGAHL
jgi:hypothetical protein